MPPNAAPPADARALTQALLQCGLLEPAGLAALERSAAAHQRPLIDELLAGTSCSAAALAQALARHFNLPLLDLDCCRPEQLLAHALGPAPADGWPLLALQLDPGRRVLACSDPTARAALELAQFQSGGGFELVLVEHDKLRRWLSLLGPTSSLDQLAVEPAAPPAPEPDAAAGGSPLVRFVQSLFDDAVRLGASDLHVEPGPGGLRIRIRVDGRLRDLAQPPRAIHQPLLVRIKVLSRLDIAQTRLPQDGRMRLRCGGREVDFRVSSMPTVHGEKLALRLLDPGFRVPALNELGYTPSQLACVQSALQRGDGMVLVTGPTGSGKSLSLYAFLQDLNQPGINISTAEDPVEIPLGGINQVQINDRVGFGFAQALRGLLRQDPDILMVGEIRDRETAEIAVQAAQTGHLLLSTLHTADAPSVPDRLRNIGVPPYDLAACLSLVCSQRLLRRLCPRCRQPVQLPPYQLLAAGCTPQQLRQPWHAHSAAGCADCGNSGYRGRFAVHQLMPISDALRQLLLERAPGRALALQAGQAGMGSLRQSALEAVRLGLSSLPEAVGSTPAGPHGDAA